MPTLAEFLYPAPAERSLGGIVRWWEARRLPYNLIVGASGVFALGVIRLISWLPPEPRPAFVPGDAILVFGLLANVCYLLGPAVEAAANSLWGRSVLPIGPALFRMGLTFSVGLTLLPIVVVTIDLMFHIVNAVF